MQYQTNESNQTQLTEQKTHFGLFHIIHANYAKLIILTLTDNIIKSWRPFSTIKICNMKSIKWTNLHKMAKNLIFGSLDHSKTHFEGFWMTQHDLVVLPNVEKHIVLPKYAISSGSNRPKSRKQPKTCILALWIIQKCIFVTFEWSSMSDIIAKLLETFSII